jgi:hypothetical protein
MSFAEHSCHTAVCDQCDDGWEEGPWHFDSRDALLKEILDYGWLVTEEKILCQQCAKEADCAATGHQWDEWEDREMERVPYKSRWCEHCGHTETDPPFRQLSDLTHIARTINGLSAEEAQ